MFVLHLLYIKYYEDFYNIKKLPIKQPLNNCNNIMILIKRNINFARSNYVGYLYASI